MRPAKPENVLMFDYAQRRASVGDRMRQAGIDLLFLPISGDLEYLTGIPRREPSFGNVAYRHGWVAGAFLRPGADPVVVLPRMITEFELPGGAAGDVVIVHETDDGDAVLGRVAAGLGPVRSLAVGARTWAETLIHLRQALRDPAISTADDLINPLRRIKSPDEMERMAGAARIVDEVMAVIGPQVLAGVTEADVAARLADRIVRHRHHLQRQPRSARCRHQADHPAHPRGHLGLVRLWRRRRWLLLGLRPHRLRRRTGCRVPARLRARHRVAGRRHQRRSPWRQRERGRSSQPPGDRGGRVWQVVSAPNRARHRPRCARVSVHLGGGPDATRAGHDVYDRAVSLLAGPCRRPHRGRHRLRGEGRPQAESLPGDPRGQRLTESGQNPLAQQPDPRLSGESVR